MPPPTLSTVTPETREEFRRQLLLAVAALENAAILFGESRNPFACSEALADRRHWESVIRGLLQ